MPLTPMTFDPSKDEIARLVKHYQINRAHYRSPGYKEAQARGEFIDKFFEHLGWDVRNTEQAAPRFREVVLEDSLEIEGQRKAPDYAFRMGDAILFYVEAKKPGVDVKNDPVPAYQLRRYGWSGKLALSLLTDFEELAVYDCRPRPTPKDKAAVARVNYYACDEYPDRWRDIWDVFSREAVRGGAFDAFIVAGARKRGVSTVDAEFLKEIEGWRDALAKNIALRNPRLGIDDLNDAVQRLIDRLIFLRMAEDRGLEEYGRLQHIAEGEHLLKGLMTLSRRADARYNSGLFDPRLPESKTLDKLAMDDKVLRPILGGLYYPESPYEFSVLPVDLLGNVYEQFLGKVIRLTAGHQAKVEEKPEVKKAGGVYYTPTYIVDYIVKHTVGVALAGKAPSQLKGFRVLDAACGSGSFLLGAYQFLLDYYQGWYAAHEPEKQKKAVQWLPSPAGSEGEWALTVEERKRILTEHIFGVDIDRQAVEVTKLSLLLKVLEGVKQMSLLEERILPNLDANIKCGNSLIGPDYFADRLFPDEAELKRVNPFDWQKEFPQVFNARPERSSETLRVSSGGFDVVIGNPPYVRQESLSELKNYLQKHYQSYDGVADLYIYFIEKGLNLLRAEGLFSIIVSSSFLRATYGKPLRQFLSVRSAVLGIVDFGGLAVFENAKDTYVCIPLLSNSQVQSQVSVCKVQTLEGLDLERYVSEHHYYIPTSRLTADPWSLDDEARNDLFRKIMAHGVTLGEYVKGRIFYGIKTGLNEAFIIDDEKKKSLIARSRNSADIIKPLLQGEDIRRWYIDYKDRYLIFTRRGINIDLYPAVRDHLSQWKEDLTPKQTKSQKRGRKPGRYKWFEIQDDVAYYEIFDGPKIIFPDIAKEPRFYFDTSGHYLANTAYALGTDDLYLLGVLNSKVFWFAISKISIPFGTRAGKYRYRLIYQYMEKVPIRPINFSDPADKTRHDRMVVLVEKMLDLHKRKAAAGGAAEAERLQRLIDDTDAQIDALVFELYGLTEDEIRVVEGRNH